MIRLDLSAGIWKHWMRRLQGAGIVLLVLVTLSAEGRAADLCTELHQLNAHLDKAFADHLRENTEVARLYSTLEAKLNFYWRLIRQKVHNAFVDPALLEPPPNGPFDSVTVQHGIANMPVCGKVEVEPSTYYPIGLIVRVLGRTKLPYGGQLLPHVYVVAEHGLRLFLPEHHVQPLVENQAYFFQDAAGEHYYCFRESYCERTISDGEKSWEKGLVALHPDFGYATAALDPELTARIEAYGNLRAQSIDRAEESPLTPEEADRALDTICSPFLVQHHQAGGKVGYTRAYLSFCTQRPGPDSHLHEALGSVKVVTQKRAQAIFSSGIQGSYQRIGASLVDVRKKLADLFNKQWMARKDCDTTVVLETFLSLGTQLDVGFDSKFFKFGLGGKGNSEVKTTWKEPEDRFYVVSAYSVTPIPKLEVGPAFPNRAFDFFDIKSTSVCKNGLPAEPVNIAITHRDLGEILLMAESADNEPSKSVTAKYWEAFGNHGYSAIKDPNYLERGKFWKIISSDQYFFWRETLRSKLRHDVPEMAALLNSVPIESHDALIDFYVHLILVSAFEYNRSR